jgi:hypothetical protein
MLLHPDQLEIDATIPQILDNQYVSSKTYQKMVKNYKNFHDKDIMKAREEEAKREFIRSLIYSSQVIINRAFLINNKFIYDFYLEGKNEISAISFAELVNHNIIVPYLLKGKRLNQDMINFGTVGEGKKAFNYLLTLLDANVNCVRLSPDEQENSNQIEGMSVNFREYFMGHIVALKARQHEEMARELFGGKHSDFDEDKLKAFRNRLLRLSQYVTQHFFETDDVSRDDIYKKYIIQPNKSVADGIFAPSDKEEPFRFELKKLVDLKYNSNLSDMLGLYTFTPLDMPTVSTLQEFTGPSVYTDSSKLETLVGEDLKRFGSITLANAKKKIYLPILSELTLSDVLKIRELPSWLTFMQLQQDILRNPLNIANQFENFQKVFYEFQYELADWYYEKYPNQTEIKEKKYVPTLNIGINIQGKTYIYGLDKLLQSPNNLQDIPVNKVPRINIKIIMGVADIGRQCLDEKRSHSVELIRSGNDLDIEGQDARNLAKNTFTSSVLLPEQDRN